MVLARYCYFGAAAVVFFLWNERRGSGVDAFWSDWGPVFLIVTVLMVLGRALSWASLRLRQRWRDRRARRLLEDILEADAPAAARPFALFLRPFSTTGRMTVRNPRRRWLPFLPTWYEREELVEFETTLASALEPECPLVALGRPGEHVGAGRIAADDAEWQEMFRRLAALSRWILMLPSESGPAGRSSG